MCSFSFFNLMTDIDDSGTWVELWWTWWFCLYDFYVSRFDTDESIFGKFIQADLDHRVQWVVLMRRRMATALVDSTACALQIQRTVMVRVTAPAVHATKTALVSTRVAVLTVTVEPRRMRSLSPPLLPLPPFLILFPSASLCCTRQYTLFCQACLQYLILDVFYTCHVTLCHVTLSLVLLSHFVQHAFSIWLRSNERVAEFQ